MPDDQTDAPARSIPRASDQAAERVRSARERLGLRRTDLAAMLAELGWPALTHTALGYLETGRRDERGIRRREISLDEVIVMAEALGTTPCELAGFPCTHRMVPADAPPVDVDMSAIAAIAAGLPPGISITIHAPTAPDQKEQETPDV